MKGSNDNPIPEEFEGRDVGQLAEDIFRMWISSETAVTCNPPENDKEGWDFLLEFPFIKPEEGKPWDTAASRPKCLIQVKGKDVNSRKQKRRDVKLDNWQKLIYDPLPAFFVIYEFDGSTLQQAYLIHVDKQWMEKGLKRLRQSRQGMSRPLHKQYMSLTWSNKNTIDPPNGRGLITAILTCIGNDIDAYIEDKQRMRRELGFEAPFIMHVKGKEYDTLDEMFEDMVPFALGKAESPFTVTVEKDVRFGIPSEVIEEHEALLTALPEGTPVTLTFRTGLEPRAATFSAKIYSPHYFFPGMSMPTKYKKYRIEYPLGEWVFTPSDDPTVGPRTGEIQLQPDLSVRPVSIRDLANTWRVISMLHAAATNPVHLEIKGVSGPVIRVASIQECDIPQYLVSIAQAVEDAWFLVRHLDLPVIDLEVTLAELTKQAVEFRAIRILLERNHPPFRAVTGSLDIPSLEPEKKHAMIFGRLVTLDDYRILVAVGMGGPYRTWDRGLRFEIAPLMPISTKVYFLSQGGTVRESLASVSEELTEEGYVVLGIEPALAAREEEE